MGDGRAGGNNEGGMKFLFYIFFLINEVEGNFFILTELQWA